MTIQTRSRTRRTLATGTTALAALLAFASPLAAQGPVAAACQTEIAKYCADKEHGKGAVRACLEANKANVSTGCKTALDSTGPGRGMGGMGGGMGQPK